MIHLEPDLRPLRSINPFTCQDVSHRSTPQQIRATRHESIKNSEGPWKMRDTDKMTLNHIFKAVQNLFKEEETVMENNLEE